MSTKTAPLDDLDQLAERLEHAAAFETRLWSDSPEVGLARARLSRLPRAMGVVRTAMNARIDSVSSLVSRAIDSVLDGQELDTEQLRADVTAALMSVQVAEAVNNAIAGASHDVPARVRDAETAAAPAALAVLDAAVKELVEAGRELLPLCELTGDRHNVGRAAQARVLLEVAVRAHDVLRARQQTLTKSQVADAAALVRRYGIVRDVSTLAPWALDLGADGWQDAPDLEELVVAGGEPFFRLVCRDDLEPWVPTEPELLAAKEAIEHRVEQARVAARNPGRVVEAASEDEPRFSMTGDTAGLSPKRGRIF